MKYLFVTLTIFILVNCTPARIALDKTQWQQTEELSVKGRQGFLVKQKLSFGNYQSSAVKRSWTKGSSWGQGIALQNDWIDQVYFERGHRKQTVRFRLSDGRGRESEVTAFAKLRWKDLRFNSKPNHIVNIIGDILAIGDESQSTYAVRIVTEQSSEPWEMLIDNQAAQVHAKKYRGLLARSRDDYYEIVPVSKLLNKKGEAVSLPFGGSVGFEFRNRQGIPVAAVSLIDGGVVYFNLGDEKEKFLLANAAAALLLQEEIGSDS